MEAKKTKKADLKSKQVLFLEIGMIAAIGLVMAAFQWSTEDRNLPVLTDGGTIDYTP